MIRLSPQLREQLRANDRARCEALRCGEPTPDPVPVVRFFNPVGAATWLATELDEDGILFGLADLGFGCPEMGSFALGALEAIRLPFGLGIERDLHFEGRFPLSVYADAARRTGSLIEAERLLNRAAPPQILHPAEGMKEWSDRGSRLRYDHCCQGGADAQESPDLP